jgi:hypothetical protein
LKVSKSEASTGIDVDKDVFLDVQWLLTLSAPLKLPIYTLDMKVNISTISNE